MLVGESKCLLEAIVVPHNTLSDSFTCCHLYAVRMETLVIQSIVNTLSCVLIDQTPGLEAARWRV